MVSLDKTKTQERPEPPAPPVQNHTSRRRRLWRFTFMVLAVGGALAWYWLRPAAPATAANAKAGTAEDAQTAVNTLAKVVSTKVPVAPIMYAAGWYEYNTTNYSGWVDKANQYMDPAPNPAGVAYVILHLKPAA